MNKAMKESFCKGLPLLKKGKVRDIYDLGENLLMVATDRISAFDVIMNDPVPDKGKILTQISLFWFDVMRSIVPNHLITADVEKYPEICRPFAEELKDRSMLVKKAEPLPVECVVRGYIAGSGWKSYKSDGSVCGIRLPKGLRESDRLLEPIFTPSTKAELGEHDENIELSQAAEMVGKDIIEKVRDISLAIYEKGASIASEKGIIIADTKFEFGKIGDSIVLIDELLTPDSSRFWPKDSYCPGGPQQSYDKQYLRDYLTGLDWNRKPPPPPLPDDVIKMTRAKYMEALERLTGKKYEF